MMPTLFQFFSALRRGRSGAAQPPSDASIPGLQDIHLQTLRQQRILLDNAQRAAMSSLQDIEAERQGLVARYADARLNGTKVVLRAIERQYKSLQSQLRHLEKRHDHLNRLLQLLQETEEIKEASQWRQAQAQAGLLGMDLPHLAELLEQAVADDLLQSKRLDDLLNALDNISQDAALAREGATHATRQELMELTESEVLHQHRLTDAASAGCQPV